MSIAFSTKKNKATGLTLIGTNSLLCHRSSHLARSQFTVLEVALLHIFFPGLEIHGWEIDGVLVDKARDYLGLKELETANDQGGVLKVFVEDALAESNTEDLRYAGIIVDLFSNGKVLDEMEDKEFWVGVKRRLRPGGRLMVNCGGAENVRGAGVDDEWVVNLTIKAMCELFVGELCWKKMPKMEGANYMAMSGEMLELGEWEGSVPEKLSAKVWEWMPFPNVPTQ